MIWAVLVLSLSWFVWSIIIDYDMPSLAGRAVEYETILV